MSRFCSRYRYALASIIFLYIALAIAQTQPGAQAAVGVSRATSSSISRPAIRDSNIELSDFVVKEFNLTVARGQSTAPGSRPILAEFVDLDVSRNINEVVFEFTLTRKEPFIAIDGASLSGIEVAIAIHYPDSTYEVYVTTQDNPLHKVIPNPAVGRYRIRLSIETGWTRAWIQVTTASSGVAVLEDIEKQFRYMVPGEARYISFSMRPESWVLVYSYLVRGGYLKIELWKKPGMTLVREHDAYGHQTLFIPYHHLGEGDYMLCIRSIGHTEVSYTIANNNAAKHLLDLDKGLVLGYTLPYDIEFLRFKIPRDVDWVALDWSVEPREPGHVYSQVIVVGPRAEVLYWDSAGVHDLKYAILKNIEAGEYVVILIGTSPSLAVLRLTSPRGVIDISSTPVASLNITFTQCGQAVYYKVKSNHTFAVVVNSDRVASKASILSTNGDILEDYYVNSFAVSIGGYSLLATSGLEYIVRVQSQRGSVLLHLRPSGYVDHIASTPDYSDFRFRFPGDIIVLGVSTRGSRYLAQYYASINSSAESVLWLIDADGVVRSFNFVRDSRAFTMLRHQHEVEKTLSGVWRLIVVSSRPGVNVRVSQMQEGDEYHGSIPYHEYHDFGFHYELVGVRVAIRKSKWALIASFNQVPEGEAWVYVLNRNLDMVVHQHLYHTWVQHTLLQDVEDDIWTLIIVGVPPANISVSILTHVNLIAIAGEVPVVTIPYPVTVTKTVTEPATIATATLTIAGVATTTVFKPTTMYATIYAGTTTVEVPVSIPVETVTQTLYQYIRETAIAEEPRARAPVSDISIPMLVLVVVLQIMSIALLINMYRKG